MSVYIPCGLCGKEAAYYVEPDESDEYGDMNMCEKHFIAYVDPKPVAPKPSSGGMSHFVYTLDIATLSPLSEEEQYEIRMAIDALIAEWPREFEDWKTTWHEERRVL